MMSDLKIGFDCTIINMGGIVSCSLYKDFSELSVTISRIGQLFIIILLVQPHKNFVIFAQYRALCTPSSKAVTSFQSFCRQKRFFLLHNSEISNVNLIFFSFLDIKVIIFLFRELQTFDNIAPLPDELFN